MQKLSYNDNSKADNPFLAIWMVTYNQEKYIGKAIESVLMQKTSFSFRLFIGEDCSNDHTREICLAYNKQYPGKIKLILNDHNDIQINSHNVYKACFNSGAKYIALLEGDDYWTDPDKLQKQVDFLEANPQYSLCFTNSLIVDEQNKIIKNDRVPENKKHNLTQEEILSGYCPPSNTVLMKNELVNKYTDHFSGIVNGDFFLFSLLAQHGGAAYLDINSAVYRMHNNGIWSNKDEDYRLINTIRVNRKLEKFVLRENQNIVQNTIKNSYKRLGTLNSEESFTDGNLWTPQTAMLRAIRDIIMQVDGIPLKALSIDNNPILEKILHRKWPEMEIVPASYPEYDAQNLYQFNNETFDIVFSHQVLEHIPKPWIAAKEMNRVLKSGGIGVHTTCSYNPRYGYPEFRDYYRFLPDGLAELFDNVNVWVKDGWGNKDVLVHNLTVDDGYGQLGGRRFPEAVARKNDMDYPWYTWIIFQKN